MKITIPLKGDEELLVSDQKICCRKRFTVYLSADLSAETKVKAEAVS